MGEAVVSRVRIRGSEALIQGEFPEVPVILSEALGLTWPVVAVKVWLALESIVGVDTESGAVSAGDVSKGDDPEEHAALVQHSQLRGGEHGSKRMHQELISDSLKLRLEEGVVKANPQLPTSSPKSLDPGGSGAGSKQCKVMVCDWVWGP
jgi:hypothetical protein